MESWFPSPPSLELSTTSLAVLPLAFTRTVDTQRTLLFLSDIASTRNNKRTDGCVDSAGVDMEAEGDDDDGVEGEEDECVEDDGLSVGSHAAEVHRPVGAGRLQHEPRRQQHE
ncbi:hypothetical protein GW17_00017102 [Ensete ventricosum]|nr:hypothetical protein GW17_00017102 [Ensete ventricosum]RZS26843.1 hypothetical protein BHM03_00060244 [Ensete ventricosum]